MLIQFVLLAAILAVTYLLGHSTSSSRHMAFRRMFLIAFAAIATAAVIFPQLMTTVASWFGVGRGADLLLYLLVVAFIGSLAMQSRRAAELNRRITLLNRRVAILEAEAHPHYGQDADVDAPLHLSYDANHDNTSRIEPRLPAQEHNVTLI